MSRKKEFFYEEETELKRVLNVFDLTFLGIGSMLGMGVYIMVGDLANKVGPAMVVSFIMAGIASTLSAMCYAEFAGRTPGTGSAYAYCYITIGEFIAFILGWNLCLEFVIGTACLARGMSGYVDSLFSGAIGHYLNSTMHMKYEYLSHYPDFFSFALMIIFTAIISSGVKESTTFNNIFVTINSITIVVLVVVGIIHVNPKNWSLPPSPGGGVGGFMPYGFSSVMEGAATCFYAYTGFDTVATTGAEAKNPKKTIPLALVLSISCAVIVYTCISTTFTLMWPYTDPHLINNPPYPYVLDKLELSVVKWFVIVGATAAVTGCLLASLFGMARIFYSIAYDGLIFKYLSKVNSCTRTPVRSTAISGLLTGLISILFSTEQLIEMTSLGTLMAYTMVAVCVLILRYEDKEMQSSSQYFEQYKDYGFSNKLLNVPKVSLKPNQLTSSIVKWCTLIVAFMCVCLGAIFAFGSNYLLNSEPFVIFAAVLLAILIIFFTIIIGRQPQSKVKLSFKVYPVPLLPVICIFINVYLMLKLNHLTWIRFFIWLVLGLLMYFCYGIWNSEEGKPRIVK
ncbi:high affinity cationic amino acid transporter 1-like isoform X2 [Rhodnius prolixus]